jgi:hypothetical protein
MITGIDHIVYACRNLEQGIKEIKEKTGVVAVYGGKHLDFGTHNALINIGNEVYLEIIAPDPSNQKIDPPRWMGVDLIKDTGRITRVALKSDDLEKDVEILRKISPKCAHWGKGSRKTSSGKDISWKMAYPLAEPLIDLVPFMVEWKGDYHPTQDIPEMMNLLQIDLYAENPADFLDIFPEGMVQIYSGSRKEIKVRIRKKDNTIVFLI